MHVIETVEDFRTLRDEWRAREEGVGFVPTMGALHAGHAKLVERARHECRQVVVSIFVNPTQFNDPLDLQKYPRPLRADLELLRGLDVSAVFLPQAAEIYRDNFSYTIVEKKLSEILCGPKRPGHFSGMLTVVLKLLNIIQPERAYFGEKDYQQLLLIREMCAAFFLPTEIVPCATVRETDGLALSSRNSLLKAEERRTAPELFRILSSAATALAAGAQLEALGFRVDYVEEHFGRRFAAAFLGSVRLIDNVEL